jgi:hypothetical protein
VGEREKPFRSDHRRKSVVREEFQTYLNLLSRYDSDAFFLDRALLVLIRSGFLCLYEQWVVCQEEQKNGQKVQRPEDPRFQIEVSQIIWVVRAPEKPF